MMWKIQLYTGIICPISTQRLTPIKIMGTNKWTIISVRFGVDGCIITRCTVSVNVHSEVHLPGVVGPICPQL